MNLKKLYFSFNIFLLFLLNVFLHINCKDTYKNKKYYEKYLDSNNNNICTSISPDTFYFNEENYKKDDFEPEIINRIINTGKVQTEYLYNPNIYKFNFSYTGYEEDLFVHFYPLDCQIKIVAISENDEDIKIKKISNYEYDSYFAVIKKGKLESSYFKIKPLINSIDDNYKNRTYYLVINSFENNNNSKLYLNEKEPTLIYFDNLKNITLSYELNSKPENPVVFSFFIKERAKFEVEILDSEQNHSIIAYKDNIIINPESISYSSIDSKWKISILITKYDTKISDMIVKATGNYSISSYLHKNKMNLEYMPINIIEQYFYMEVFKDEEGEIMLNNKWQNGVLIGTIIKKGNISEDDNKNINNYFPKYNNIYSVNNNENLYFNEYSQKLIFNSSQTSFCEKGCYLLITYYSPKFNITTIKGIEFTLLSKIWDKEEFVPQIVNIPLNEYIFGSFEYSSIIVHYYSIYIPENNTITIEIQGTNNIAILAKLGQKKINFLSLKEGTIFLKYDIYNTDNFKLIIDLNRTKLGIDTFENQYITFAFVLNYYEINTFSNYYFRILQQNSNENYLIYPLDTNKANICKTVKMDENNYTCFFLVSNNYKELDSPSVIYAYGIKGIKYKLWEIELSDYYSININKIVNLTTILSRDGGYYKIFPKNNSLLIQLTSDSEEILTVLYNYYGKFLSIPSLNIYSYQLFFLQNLTLLDIYFAPVLSNQYRIFINTTRGIGHLSFNDNENETLISGNIFYSFYIPEDIKIIHIDSLRNLIFNIKMNNQILNVIMEEIHFGYSRKNIKNNTNTIIYYIKDVYNQGLDINFYFNDFNYDTGMRIRGYNIEYNTIKSINDETQLEFLLLYYHYIAINGSYDIFTKKGLLVIDKESNDDNENEKSNINDKYYLIIINTQFFSDFTLEMQVNTKEENNILPFNKYIRGSFSLLKNNTQNQNYVIYIDSDELKYYKDYYYILEFSSNNKNIELVFNDNFKYNMTEINGGIYRYFIPIASLKTQEYYTFTVKMNNIDKEKEEKYLLNGNYILRLYRNVNITNLDYIFNLTHTFEILPNNSTSNDYNSYNLTLKTNEEYEKNKILTDNCTCLFYARLISKKKYYKNEILNTTAIIQSEIYNYSVNSYEPNKQLSFIFNDLPINENYIISILIIVKNNFKDEKLKNIILEENYYSIQFEENTTLKDSQNDEDKEDKTLIIILSVVFGCILLITIIISLFVCKAIRKRNKVLEGRIEAISFSSGLSEENFENDNKKAKKDEDYETTFI